MPVLPPRGAWRREQVSYRSLSYSRSCLEANAPEQVLVRSPRLRRLAKQHDYDNPAGVIQESSDVSPAVMTRVDICEQRAAVSNQSGALKNSSSTFSPL